MSPPQPVKERAQAKTSRRPARCPQRHCGSSWTVRARKRSGYVPFVFQKKASLVTGLTGCPLHRADANHQIIELE